MARKRIENPEPEPVVEDIPGQGNLFEEVDDVANIDWPDSPEALDRFLDRAAEETE